MTKRKPHHPGIILDELYIKPLNLNVQELADKLKLSKLSLFKIRRAQANITPLIAIRLAEVFDTTTPDLWLSLQQKYDLYIENEQSGHN